MDKTKSFILYLLKFISAGIVALIILSILICFYSVTPVHMDNPKGNTDYVWIPNSYWVNATEGLSFGKLDSDGFNNKKKIDNPDVLLVGSSHIEAKNVNYNDSVAGLLSKEFEGKHSIYNVGMSGHHFYKACQYLPDNLKLYKGSLKYIVIETSDVALTGDKVEETLSHTVERTPSFTDTWIGKLQRIPIFYAVYKQLDGGLLDILLDRQKNDNAVAENKEFVDVEAYETMFDYLNNIEKDGNIDIIVVYHPIENFDNNGNILFDNSEHLKTFRYFSEKYDIDFIDLSSDFTKTYYESYKVPHGFVTGKIGVGHLNTTGHFIAAQEIYKKIMEKDR